MSKSIGNSILISELLKKTNPNIIRLFCLSAHYSKPLDYSEENIDKIKTKWAQIDNAYHELRYRIDNKVHYHPIIQFNYAAFKSNCSEFYKEFENFIEDDLNFSNALTSFFKFINKINNIFSIEVADNEISLFVFELLEKFMFVLGLRITPVPYDEKDKIQKLIEKRNTFRSLKNYGKADGVRKELYSKFNVELTDHKGFTVWRKIN
jgi:cysteinyl-tRNA synthetase